MTSFYHKYEKFQIWLWKPFASAAFVLFAVHRGAFDTTYGRAILAALVLSLIGDVLLIPRSKATFLSGLLAFLLAHAAYGVAFVIRGVAPAWAFMAGVLLVFAGFAVSLWLMPRVKGNEPSMLVPVGVYMTTITVMVALAAGASGGSGDFRILVGALLFYVSDLSVARDKFVAPGRVNRLWGLPLYYAAQFLLASTVRS
jgi:uncharacterized membrane protein YhhN